MTRGAVDRRHETERHGTEPHGTGRHGTEPHGTERWHGTERHGTEREAGPSSSVRRFERHDAARARATPRPLVVAADPEMREQIARVAAAAGCETDVVDDVHAARPLWARAPLILVGDHALLDAEPGLPRRSGVLLVCAGTPPPNTWRQAVVLGAEDVLALPDDESTLLSALGDVVEQPSTRRGPVLAVVGGRGGAGASVLTAAVGVRAARSGADALLVDCDPLGGGLDLLLGVESADGLRWPGVRVSAGRVSMTELDSALPVYGCGPGVLSVLSCGRGGDPPSPAAVAAVVDAGVRAGRTVACDLPRRIDERAEEVLRRADLVVLVVPAEVRACLAARGVLDVLGDAAARTRVVVRGPADRGPTVDDVGHAVGAPVLGVLGSERGLGRAVERGSFRPRGRGPLDSAAGAVLDRLMGGEN